MANCLECGVELNDANKCVCNYCMDHCHCGSESEAETQNEAVKENVGENKDDMGMDVE